MPETGTLTTILIVLILITLGLAIYNLIMTLKLKKKYVEYMTKVGDGQDITNVLKNYVEDVTIVKENTQTLKKYCREMEQNMNKCIQKVGMIRYNPYQNTGSDLCFALALLDFEDSGVVINGVYSRDNTTNTYAKPIEKGKSKYTLVKEEEEALNIAKQNGYKYFIDVDTGKQKLENK
ncbi:MAG: DUF4446 family protein [Clostridia bacterium]|nr:DUF4446 family protein [Clostridia bacterium]